MRKVAQLLILIVLAILIIPFFLPKSIDVSIEKEFNISSKILFENFNNLNEFSKWEPWSAEFPDAAKEFFAPYQGKNAGYNWFSESKYGKIIISHSTPSQHIEFVVKGNDLGEESRMTVDFQEENKGKTKVKWSVFSDEMSYFSRYYIYFTKEKLITKLNEGFERLEMSFEPKVITPESSRPSAKIIKEHFDGLKLVAVLNSTSLDNEEIKTATEESFGFIYSYLVDYLKLPSASVSNPVNYVESVNLALKRTKFYSGYPLSESIQLDEKMQLISIPASDVLVSIHEGKQEDISQTLNKMKDYAKENNLKLKNIHWEEYVGGKETKRIKIYIPIR